MLHKPRSTPDNGPQRPATVITNLAEREAFWADIASSFANMDLGPTLQRELGFLELVHNDYFYDAQDPGGNAWQPLAPSTIAAKGHDTILVDSGRLINSLTQQGPDAIRRVEGGRGNYELVFGTSVEYAIFHDTGTARMPARPAVGWSDETLDEIEGHVADGAIEEMQK